MQRDRASLNRRRPRPGPDPVDAIKGGLVVSCQAREGDPLHGTAMMSAMARAAADGGAAGIRLNGSADVRAVTSALTLPVIGLWKDGDEGVYITPTARHALAVADAGADIVAVDATDRPRPDGRSFRDTVTALHDRGVRVMADIATVTEGLAAQEAGADLVGTTLSGYTEHTPRTDDEPDLPLVRALVGRLAIPVIAEGRFHLPHQVAAAFDAGAHAVVVGTAITAPAWITRRFAAEAPRRGW
ncbi:N-acetylmannosamine-6-phosphate 2-epimerase [Streptomyces griseoluteus]|uniref:N-acetylmannosamine-6-phosphate 2-epimerase n=1 Tax=Streptomyces griseoluteus TaxID=29306 RepID=UPI0036FEF158